MPSSRLRGLSDLIGSVCSIRESATAHPAGGVFRNKHEIKGFGFFIAGEPGVSPWHPLCVWLSVTFTMGQGQFERRWPCGAPGVAV